LTANPPHNQITILSPTIGTADTRLVITVAPQRDICPQGNTYPKKAVIISIKRIVTPLNHVLVNRKE
jgi:phosphatidate phosphatase PAH1